MPSIKKQISSTVCGCTVPRLNSLRRKSRKEKSEPRGSAIKVFTYTFIAKKCEDGRKMWSMWTVSRNQAGGGRSTVVLFMIQTVRITSHYTEITEGKKWIYTFNFCRAQSGKLKNTYVSISFDWNCVLCTDDITYYLCMFVSSERKGTKKNMTRIFKKRRDLFPLHFTKPSLSNQQD